MYSYNKRLLVLGLIWAAGRGFSEVVKILLDAGAKVDVGDKVRRAYHCMYALTDRKNIF